jgi:hypothetical protein
MRNDDDDPANDREGYVPAASRVYAEGWKAARGLLVIGREDFDVRKIEATNPYSTAAERARWAQGFRSAFNVLGG